ncbi:hypothetical protein L596_009282 [Steinernema carpocapsae]|uniref:Uncharacterized protein n=1 Tax=Steinernema carpocapsae TaxID=34508 RepID=A0A4U5PG40_STECR|nr:hypothetical protein L596_009282 [Steinernema carpocapsae]
MKSDSESCTPLPAASSILRPQSPTTMISREVTPILSFMEPSWLSSISSHSWEGKYGFLYISMTLQKTLLDNEVKKEDWSKEAETIASQKNPRRKETAGYPNPVSCRPLERRSKALNRAIQPSHLPLSPNDPTDPFSPLHHPLHDSEDDARKSSGPLSQNGN